MSLLLAPSMQSANYDALGAETELLDQSGADIFHIDMMDGSFVPNLAMGVQDIACIRRHTKKPVDAHLMIMNPARYVPLFADLGVNILYIHPEADLHPARTLADIAERGMSPGLAVNPGTSFETVRELLPLCRYILCMTVNPGFAGQSFLPYVLHKIRRFAEQSKTHGYIVFADGGVSPEVKDSLIDAGAGGLVLGWPALFSRKQPYADSIGAFRAGRRC